MSNRPIILNFESTSQRNYWATQPLILIPDGHIFLPQERHWSCSKGMTEERVAVAALSIYMELHSCPARSLIITFFPLIWRSQDLHLDATSSRPSLQLPGQRCKECAVISQLKNIWKIFTIHRAHSTLNSC